MGFFFFDWVRAQLEKGFDFNDSTDTGAPVGEVGYSPWTEAFQDQQHREKATQGLLQFVRLRHLERVNFLDFMVPRYGSSHWTFSSRGDFWYTEGTSGNAALRIRKENPAGDGFPEAASPLFRVQAGRVYRLTVKWKSTLASVQTLGVNLTTFASDRQTPVNGYNIVAAPPFSLAGTNGSWRYDSRIFELGADDRWGSIRIIGGGGFQTPTPQDIDIDEIRLEEVGPSFFAFRQTAAQTVNAGATAQVVFNSASFNYGGDYDTATGTFTCRIPGRYQFSATVTLAAMADQQELRLALRHNGSDQAAQQVSSSGAQDLSGSVSFVRELERGDTVQVFITNGDVANRNIAVSAANQFSGGKVA